MASYRRSAILISASSLLAPAVGVLTAPLLARTLGAVGRGEVAAGAAPYFVAVTGVTLGLPQAMTYYVAKRPREWRSVLLRVALATAPLGIAVTVCIYLGRTYLAGGDSGLATLISLGGLLIVPGLMVGLLRGAAMGLQMWTAVAVERTVTAVVRLGGLGSLAFANQLDVWTAVLVTCGAPIVAGCSYLGIVFKPAFGRASPSLDEGARTSVRSLMSFGSTVWFGAVATMVMARLSEIFVVPLSDAEQLGLLVVAVTVSDIPYIVTQAIRDMVFGSNTAEPNVNRILAMSQILFCCSILGCLAIGATLPLWLTLVFGGEFSGSLVPSWILLTSSCVAVPGLIAGAGLDSVGRPGLKSAVLVVSLLVNLALLFVLVPKLGAVGAACAVLVSTTTASAVTVHLARRELRTSYWRFWVPGRKDIREVLSLVRSSARKQLKGGGGWSS